MRLISEQAPLPEGRRGPRPDVRDEAHHRHELPLLRGDGLVQEPHQGGGRIPRREARGPSQSNKKKIAFFLPTSRRDFLTYESNKFSFKHVMKHVIRIPHKCHIYFIVNLLRLYVQKSRRVCLFRAPTACTTCAPSAPTTTTGSTTGSSTGRWTTTTSPPSARWSTSWRRSGSKQLYYYVVVYGKYDTPTPANKSS